jgi:hypothetical protein
MQGRVRLISTPTPKVQRFFGALPAAAAALAVEEVQWARLVEGERRRELGGPAKL